MGGKEMLLQIQEPQSLDDIMLAVTCRESRRKLGSKPESPNWEEQHNTSVITVKNNSHHQGLHEGRCTGDFQVLFIKK